MNIGKVALGLRSWFGYGHDLAFEGVLKSILGITLRGE
jgi:hypothetical protein